MLIQGACTRMTWHGPYPHEHISAVLGAYGALQMVGQQLADKAALN